MTSPHSIRRDSGPDTNKNQRMPWNWFHTLTDRKPSVKSESRGTNILHRFSGFLPRGGYARLLAVDNTIRSEEHTSELQSQSNLVCRLLLEKKKKKYN